MTETSTEKYLTEFSNVKSALFGQNLPWLEAIRKKAARSIDTSGFPHPKHEEWKYTDIKGITEKFFQPIQGSAPSILWKELDQLGLDLTDTHPVVFLDGRFTPLFSDTTDLPKGVTIGSLQNVLTADPNAIRKYLARFSEPSATIFTDLNTAFLNDGAVIKLGRNAILKNPIQLVFISTTQETPVLSQPRNVIILEEGAQASVIQSYVGLNQKSDYLTNSVTEIVLEENAHLIHTLVQEERRQTYHINTIQALQAGNSRFDSHTFTFGGGLTRNNLNIELESENSECTLNGLFIIGEGQHVDNHTRVDHFKPECTSNELYKGILDEGSRGVFNGKVYVHPDAQKTVAYQQNPNLLLSRNAEIDTKPQLEIYANDVKCSHGATVGQLDEKSVFYLQSRGLDEAAAKNLLVYSFAEEMINKIDFLPLKNRLNTMLTNKLPALGRLQENH